MAAVFDHSLTDELGRNTCGNHLLDLEVRDYPLHDGAHVTPEDGGKSFWSIDRLYVIQVF